MWIRPETTLAIASVLLMCTGMGIGVAGRPWRSGAHGGAMTRTSQAWAATRSRTLLAIAVVSLIVIGLTSAGIFFWLRGQPATDFEVRASGISHGLWWVLLGAGLTLTISHFLVTGPTLPEFFLGSCLFFAALQVGVRICLLWLLMIPLALYEVKFLGAHKDLTSPYFLVIALCGPLALAELFAAVRAAPGLWTTRQSRVGVCLWSIGVAFCIAYLIPLMSFIIAGHAMPRHG